MKHIKNYLYIYICYVQVYRYVPVHYIHELFSWFHFLETSLLRPSAFLFQLVFTFLEWAGQLLAWSFPSPISGSSFYLSLLCWIPWFLAVYFFLFLLIFVKYIFSSYLRQRVSGKERM